jgi:hypothetical protein
MVRLPGHVLPILNRAAAVPSSTTSASEPITLTLVLKHHDQAGFDRFLRDLYDPKSPSFHRFLTQRQIADRFGPSRAEYNSVLHWMRSKGFAFERGSKNRLTLTMRGTRARAERTFAVRFHDYRIQHRTFFANDQAPAVPSGLASRIEAIAGLSNLAAPGRHIVQPEAADALDEMTPNITPELQNTLTACGFVNTVKSGTGLIPTLIANFATIAGVDLSILTSLKILNPISQMICGGMIAATSASLITCDVAGMIDPTMWARNPQCAAFAQVIGFGGASRHADGSKAAISSAVTSGTSNPQKIGLLEFDTFQPSDVSNWLAVFGGGATFAQLSEKPVNGGVASPGPYEAEVLLDTDIVMMLAALPNIDYVVYEGPSSTSFETMFNAMIDDGDTVISNSWSQCEDQTTSAEANSIDSILQTAAAAGISVFNGTGDSGSTCLDGSPNTIGVPADSPHATAVGGTTPIPGPGLTYGSETWWNGTDATPPTGQGGFGVSKFFAAPAYQTGLAAMRSVPDVVVDADPAQGLLICQADDGGCPSPLRFGGTSMAAPEWAAFAAELNAMLGTNLANANLLLYPLAGTDAFHSPASMSSDFAHVGLGSPDFLQLRLALSGETLGSVSATGSTAVASGTDQDGSVPADGETGGTVQVLLRDDNDFPISGKNVSLTASPGSHAVITPTSAVSDSDGNAEFQVTDSTVEAPTLTAADTSDSQTLAETPVIQFVTPPATQAAIGAFPTTVTADGVTDSTITITLEDTLGRPSPGKEIQLNQTGNSLITGPNPPVTNSSGQIQFTVTDTNNETVTYSATDVSDGNLPFPATAEVTFSSGPESGCANASPVAASGYVVTPYVTGLLAKNFSYGDGQVNFGGCPGAGGIAFDGSGNIYVADLPTGDIYKLPSGGGVAGSGNLLNGTLGPAVAQLVYEDDHLFAAQGATTGGTSTGGVIELDPSNGTVVGTVITGIPCAEDMAADPLTGDLFVNDACEGPAGSNTLFRVSNPGSGSSTLSSYATLPTQGNYQITFAPDGTMYSFGGTNFSGDYAGTVVKIGGTNTTQPANVTTLSSINAADDILLAAGTASGGGAQYLISGSLANNPNSSGLGTFDLSTSPPSAGAFLANSGVGIQALTTVFGPDGCVYLADGNAVFRVTDTAGDCTYSANLASPSIVLTPSTVSPNPAQGTSQTLTASVHFGTVPTGTAVKFSVTGANPTIGVANTDAGGNAPFSYVGAHAGVDNVTATTTIDSNVVTSSPALVTWGAGSDVTFMSLNQSPKGAIQGQTVNLIASLTDVSQNPATVLSGQTINFSVGSQHCTGATNAQGIATCEITAGGTGTETLSASFAGTGSLVASSASDGFNVVTNPATPTPTATATATATPTATPTPVVGKLKISPTTLNFGDVDVGSNKVKDLKITNAGKVKKKKVPLPVLIEMESGATNPFSVTQSCDDDDLGPKSKGVKAGSCEVAVTFAPTAAMKYKGTLTIDTNLETKPDRTVKLEGTGKEPKK